MCKIGPKSSEDTSDPPGGGRAVVKASDGGLQFHPPSFWQLRNLDYFHIACISLFATVSSA